MMLKKITLPVNSVAVAASRSSSQAASACVLPHHPHGGRRTTASIQTAVQSSKARQMSSRAANGDNGNGNGRRRIPASTSTSLASLATMGAVVAGATFYQLSEQRMAFAAPGDGNNTVASSSSSSSSPSLPPPAWAPLPSNVAAPVGAPVTATTGVAAVVGSAPPLPPFGVATTGVPVGAPLSGVPPLPSSSPQSSSTAAPAVADLSKPSKAVSTAPKEKKKNPGRIEDIDMASQQTLIRPWEPGMKFTLVKNVFPTGVDTQEASAAYQYHIAQGTPCMSVISP
jgi:hypothetical protein